MAEIKSIYAPQVEADLKKVFTELEKHHKLIIEMSKTSIDYYGGRQAGNPTELKNAIKAYEELTKKQKELEAQLKRLTEAKRQSNTRTSEEIVNQRVLAQNADRQAKANSTLVGAYARLNAQHQIAMQKVRDLTVAYGAQNRATRQAQKEFDVLDKKIKQADNAVRVHNRNVGNYKSALSGLSSLMGAFGVAGGVYLFAQITTDTIRLIKELQSLNLALQQVSGTQADFASNLSFIQTTSENLGLSINDLTRQFTQFYVSAKDKLARQEIEDIFTSIAKAGATMGLSLEQQNRAFLAINQMMSKGTVQAEELRGQLGEALPGAFVIMAKAIGVTEKELGDMLKKGEVLAKDVLPAFARELEKAYGIENITNVKTLTSETNRFNNAWKKLVKNVDSGNGVISKALNGILKFLTQAINGMSKLNGVSFQDKGYENAINNVKEYAQVVAETERKRLGLKVANNETIKRVEQEEAKRQLQNFEKQYKDLEAKQKQLEKSTKIIRSVDVLGNSKASRELQRIQLAKDGLIGTIAGLDAIIRGETATTNESTEATKDNTKATNDNKDAKEEEKSFILNSIGYYEELIKKAEELNKVVEQESTIPLIDNKEFQENLKFIKMLREQLDLLKNGRPKVEAVEIQPLSKGKQGNELEERLKAETDAIIEQNQAQEKAIELMRQRADEILNSFGSDFINNSGLTTFFDLVENGLGQFGDNWQAKTVAIMEATQEMFNFIANLSQAHFAQEYEDLARQKENSIQFAGESTVAREEIEKEYERRRKEIQIREAKAKRSQAMFNIGIDMAQAIMRLWVNPGFPAAIPLAVMIGSLGVAQIASVASQPLTQFWKGTDNAPEGFAEVGEKGRELIKDGKTGQWRLAEKRSVDYLTKGSTVLTNANTEKVLNFHAFNKGLTNTLVENNIDFYPIESKIDKLTNAILNKESLRIINDSNGQKYYSEKNGQLRGLNNARLEVKQSIF